MKYVEKNTLINLIMDILTYMKSTLKFSKNTILEIGIWNGNSVRAWDEYFTNTKICGMDIYDKKGIFNRLKSKNMFFQADQGNSEQLQKICESIGKFDIIIDDGSHMQYDQMISFAYMFPFMNSAGLYIIEDIVPAKGLESGSQWWATSDEYHAGHPGLSLSTEELMRLRTDDKWLPAGSKDIFNCTEKTFERYMETKLFSNTFLSEEQNRYANENIDWVEFYPAGWHKPAAVDKCTSSLVVVCKK